MSQRPRFFTGIKPTGTLTLGHYLGVIRHILAIQDQYEIIIMVGDLHALTIPNKEINYREKCYEIASLLYACGLKEENCKVFIQSEVKEHLELAFFLSPHITVGRLGDMIEYKEKKKKNETGNLALLSYPVLMAADIFLYSPDLVIVGQDQKQHLELATDIGQKFNSFYGLKLLEIPGFSIPEFGAKIMGLQNPTKKMSKSEQDYIALLDDRKEISRKVVAAVTDSEYDVYFNPEKKPGISNLLTIYALMKDLKISEAEKELEYTKHQYHHFKTAVALSIMEKLQPIQEKYQYYFSNIARILEKNSSDLKSLAEEKMGSIRKKINI